MRLKSLAISALAWLVVACAVAGEPGVSGLVYLTDEEGKELFMQSEYRSDYFSLASYLEYEQVLTFCGPATMAGVLNSLGIERPSPRRLYPYGLFTQDILFTPENQRVKSYASVESDGLVLSELASFLNNLGVTADFYHASDFSTARLREIVRETLDDPDKRLVLNYSRSGVGQAGGGHFSPLAAFDVDTDRVLILDVAKYKYPPVWVDIRTLHSSMREKDPSSGLSRGIVVVSK